ncbi:MAG: ribonuclease E inhibitor RraB [Pseudomonadota bacterium]
MTDTTQQTLERLERDGSDLTRSMEVEFFIAVLSESAATQVLDELRVLDFSVLVEKDEGEETEGWTIYWTKRIMPEYAVITSIEQQLDDIAHKVRGHIDDFDTFGNHQTQH